ERQGPYFLLLPKNFEYIHLPLLEQFLRTVPEGQTCAVEVRHPVFFSGAAEHKLNEMLHRHHAQRVILDTRGAWQAFHEDPTLQPRRNKKPLLPVRAYATGKYPFLRLICHPEWSKNKEIIDYWAQVVAQWIRDGYTPYVFFHTPHDIEVPDHARAFHIALQQHIPLPDLPPTPLQEAGADVQQLSLL
ncbi:MAG: DUF72 domain-containing protein, partial [Myxococcota bacterium]